MLLFITANRRALLLFAALSVIVAVLTVTRVYSVLVYDSVDTNGAVALLAVNQDCAVDIEEQEWLISCQLPNGALAQTPDSDLVVPYFANLSAVTLTDINPGAAAEYIKWYLSVLNMPDRWGLSGTVYDYTVHRQEHETGETITMKATRDYDSADSYASTFLSLISYFYEKTQDSAIITSYFNEINTVAEVIVKLQDKDGLVFVKPSSRTKYLIDNAENYKGLTDWANVLAELGHTNLAANYELTAKKIRNGILTELYSEQRQSFAWSLSRISKRFPNKDRWYPDGVSQLYLVICGVLSPQEPLAVKIWEDFNLKFPGWVAGEKNDQFPWGSVAIASAIMGDQDKAAQFNSWVQDAFVLNQRPYPWYLLESSNSITLADLLSPSQ